MPEGGVIVESPPLDPVALSLEDAPVRALLPAGVARMAGAVAAEALSLSFSFLLSLFVFLLFCFLSGSLLLFFCRCLSEGVLFLFFFVALCLSGVMQCFVEWVESVERVEGVEVLPEAAGVASVQRKDEQQTEDAAKKVY